MRPAPGPSTTHHAGGEAIAPGGQTPEISILKGPCPMSRWIRAAATAAILLGPAAAGARADLILAASDATVAPGGLGTIDFTVTSTGNDGLSSFGLELNIATSGPSLGLQFTPAQPDPFGDALYVFHGESSGSDLAIPFWSAPYQTHAPNDTILGGDQDDGSGLGYVAIPGTAGAPRTYLGSVQFRVPAGAIPGDQFQVSVVTGPNTYFDGPDGEPLGYSGPGAGAWSRSPSPRPPLSG